MEGDLLYSAGLVVEFQHVCEVHTEGQQGSRGKMVRWGLVCTDYECFMEELRKGVGEQEEEV